MTIEKFCDEYKNIARKQAIGISQRKRMDYSDLLQEGMLALVILYRSERLKKINKKKHIKYISLFVRGAMLKYISSMSGTLSVDHNKFFNKDFVNYIYSDAENQLDQTMPQDQALLMKERMITFNLVVKNTVPEFSAVEKFVWYEVILSETPLTTREAAKFLGYKSCSSITYIKRKILNKLKGHCNEKN